MTRKKNILYPQPMLSSVDYDNLGVNFFSLTDLEYKAVQNCTDFLEKLEQALLRTSVKNEGIWDIIGSNWKVFNLFFIFRLAVA